jgi:hypothetical protein
MKNEIGFQTMMRPVESADATNLVLKSVLEAFFINASDVGGTEQTCKFQEQLWDENGRP